jgi:hypothetical protein
VFNAFYAQILSPKGMTIPADSARITTNPGVDPASNAFAYRYQFQMQHIAACAIPAEMV